MVNLTITKSDNLNYGKEWLDMVQEISPAGFGEWDLKTGQLNLNTKAFQICSYSEKDFPRNVPDMIKLIHPDDLGIVDEFQKFIEEKAEQPFRGIFRFLGGNGDYLRIELLCEAIEFDSSKTPCRIFGIFLGASLHQSSLGDLEDKATKELKAALEIEEKSNALSLAEDTELARREAVELAEQLSLIKQAVNSSSDGIAISTISGDFYYINNTFTYLLGYSIRELAILDCKYLFYDENVFRQILNITDSGAFWQGNLEMFSQEGDPIPFFIRVVSFCDENSVAIGLVWNFTDIREQKASEKKIAQYTQRIEQDLEEKKSSLHKATLLQQSLVQTEIPLFQDYNIHACFMPCEKLGGDFFRIVKGINEAKMVIVLGDCTGHGIKVSMEASLLSRLVEKHLSFLYQGNDPGNFMNLISREFSLVADDDQFPTLFVGIIDLVSGTMSYANANGILPFVVRENDVFEMRKPQGMHLAYFDDPEYETVDFTLKPEDRIFFYSDAIEEIQLPDGKMLGKAGFRDILKRNPLLPREQFQEVIEALIEKNRCFPLDDDTTLIQFDYRPQEDGSACFYSLEEGRSLINEISSKLRLYDYSESETEKAVISLSEMVINAVTHGNKNDETKKVMIFWTINNRDVQFRIIDEGEGFDPEAVDDPVENFEEIWDRDVESEFTHGRGIWIARRYMDRLVYSQKANEVMMRFSKKNNELFFGIPGSRRR